MKNLGGMQHTEFLVMRRGTYGAGVSALLESKNWQTVDDLANVFVRWGGHAYGGAVKGEYSPELFRKRLSVMDATVKNEDNHETNMLSSDDYNAYHGGMIAAVRSIRGSAPHSIPATVQIGCVQK